MGQDSQTCPKCGVCSGYDEDKGYWPGGDKRICGQCKRNLISRFCAFFGLDGVPSTEMGLELEWWEVNRILTNIQRDSAKRVSYIVTDKEMWEKTSTMKTPMEKI